MRVDHPLRLYANPLKLLLYWLGSAMFVAAGIWMLHTPSISESLFYGVVAWACIGFFGLGVVIFLIMIFRDVFFRLPVLEIDEQGWSCRTTLFVKKQTANWQDIDHVAIYRRWMRESAIRHKPRYMYYLVVHGVDPSKPAGVSRFSARLYRFYPALREALMVVPLNTVFVRTTPEKVERILTRIRAAYDFELRLYDIRVDSEIHQM